MIIFSHRLSSAALLHDMHHFGTLTICELKIYMALDCFDLPVPSHLGSNFPAVGTDNQTMSPT